MEAKTTKINFKKKEKQKAPRLIDSQNQHHVWCKDDNYILPGFPIDITTKGKSSRLVVHVIPDDRGEFSSNGPWVISSTEIYAVLNMTVINFQKKKKTMENFAKLGKMEKLLKAGYLTKNVNDPEKYDYPKFNGIAATQSRDDVLSDADARRTTKMGLYPPAADRFITKKGKGNKDIKVLDPCCPNFKKRKECKETPLIEFIHLADKVYEGKLTDYINGTEYKEFVNDKYEKAIKFDKDQYLKALEPYKTRQIENSILTSDVIISEAIYE